MSQKKKGCAKWILITIVIVCFTPTLVQLAQKGVKAVEESEKERAAQAAVRAEQWKNPDITLTAAELDEAFEENVVKARADYENKIVRISGAVSEITSNPLTDEPIMKISTGLVSSLRCRFEDSEKNIDLISRFKKGNQISVTGIVDVTLNSPSLKSCRNLEKTGEGVGNVANEILDIIGEDINRAVEDELKK